MKMVPTSGKSSVYRAEDYNGDGPYSSQLRLIPTGDPLRGCTKDHPSPIADGIKNWHPKYRSGFTTLEALIKWFDKRELDNIWKYCYITKYEAEFILEGKNQCAFIKGNRIC